MRGLLVIAVDDVMEAHLIKILNSSFLDLLKDIQCSLDFSFFFSLDILLDVLDDVPWLNLELKYP